MAATQMSEPVEMRERGAEAGRRVLHVLWQLEVGGAERAVCQLVGEQRRRGLEADVLVGSRAGTYREWLAGFGADVHELGMRGTLDVTRARGASDVFGRYDVVHVHVPEPLLVRAAASRGRTWGAVYTHRGGVRSHGPAKRARHAAVGRALGRFDVVSANSAQSARAASSLYRISLDAIPVTHNGIDLTLLEPSRPIEDVICELPMAAVESVRVGTVANLRDWKRVERLLLAVAVLGDEPVHGVILGDGPRRAHLQLLASELGIATRVTFLGRKEPVGDYLQALDVFVLPSGPEEAFGNAVVEAMAAGLPVCVFADGGGLTEHVVDGATGFVVADQPELVDRLRELARDPELRWLLGQAGRDRARSRYGLPAAVERYERLYARALAAGAGR